MRRLFLVLLVALGTTNAAQAADALQFRVRNATFDTNTSEVERHALIDDANVKAHIDGIDDAFNPDIIDTAKADALVEAIGKLSTAKQKPLLGKAIYLNSPELLIGVSDPTTPESFKKVTSVVVTDTQGSTLLIRAPVTIDCEQAKNHAAEAKSAVAAATADIQGFKTGDKVALAEVSVRRAALAQVWQRNAQALLDGCHVSKQKAELDAATKAAGDFSLPKPNGIE